MMNESARSAVHSLLCWGRLLIFKLETATYHVGLTLSSALLHVAE